MVKRKKKPITKSDSLMADIEVNDLFSELLAENERLVNVLNELKSYLKTIHTKYETMITDEDIKQWQTLQQSMDTTVEEYNSNNNVRVKLKNKIDLNRKSSDGKQSANNDNNIDVNEEDTNQLSAQSLCQTTITTSEVSKTETIRRSSRNTNSKPCDDYQRRSRQPYDCRHTDCGQQFKLRSQLTRHYSEYHADNDDDASPEHTCQVCDKTFKLAVQLQRHVNRHEMSRRSAYKCSECGRYFTTKRNLERHRQTIHLIVNVGQTTGRTPDTEPDRCLTEFTQQTFDPKTRKYICPDNGCGLPFNTARGVYNHFIETHDTTTTDCLPLDDNNDVCSSDRQLLVLLRQNNFDESTERYLCPFTDCDRTYATNRNLSLHFQAVHYKPNDRPYVCRVADCGKGFKRKYILKEHMKTHDSDRPKAYQCSHCPKSYFKEYQLRQHMSFRHLNERILKCAINGCDEWFGTTHQRAVHRQSAHNMNYALKYPTDRHRCQWPGCDFTDVVYL
ncbi:zinc finger protein 585B-like [Oppia nitens]|uniref:zinc finger protein 585B-like n=1 Tax=Oppia nitens TaxID=1686743 RepID=UPI0023D99B12|nr:zinc finger protein 585B-like [Oppia nitens]